MTNPSPTDNSWDQHLADCHCPAIPAIDPAAIREAALREACDRIGAIVAGYELREDFRAEEVSGRCYDAILAMIGEKK